MIVSIYILFEIIFVAFFFWSFREKHELIWALTLVLGGFQMVTAYFLETVGYVWSATTGAYVLTSYSISSPYLMGINLMFFSLSLILALFDIFDKYVSEVPHEDPNLNDLKKIKNPNIK